MTQVTTQWVNSTLQHTHSVTAPVHRPSWYKLHLNLTLEPPTWSWMDHNVAISERKCQNWAPTLLAVGVPPCDVSFYAATCLVEYLVAPSSAVVWHAIVFLFGACSAARRMGTCWPASSPGETAPPTSWRTNVQSSVVSIVTQQSTGVLVHHIPI